METLPLVLLSIRMQASVAKLLYGTTPRLRGEFCLEGLGAGGQRSHILSSTSERCYASAKSYPSLFSPTIYRDLSVCAHVFVGYGKVRCPLQAIYDGRNRIFKQTDKFFTLDFGSRNDMVSLNCLKPVYLEATPEGTEHSSPHPPHHSAFLTHPISTSRTYIPGSLAPADGYIFQNDSCHELRSLAHWGV